jgi:hypothetical protein
MRALRLLLATTALFFAALRLSAAQPVDLLLVLSADASISIDEQSYRLQREGYAIALTNPRVLNAIRSGPTGRIAVLYFEWAGTNQQNVIVDWIVIDSPRTAQQFSNRLIESPRLTEGLTSIGNAIDFAAAQFAHAPYQAQHRIIDISGDGTNNAGHDPKPARDEALRRGITINALVILNGSTGNPHQNPSGGLAGYYRTNIIGGPNAFVIEAIDFTSFNQAMIKKLIAEIASVVAN